MQRSADLSDPVPPPFPPPAPPQPGGGGGKAAVLAALGLVGALVVAVGIVAAVVLRSNGSDTAPDTTCLGSHVPLNRAVADRDLDRVEQLLDHGADPDHRDRNGHAALDCTVDQGRTGLLGRFGRRPPGAPEASQDAAIAGLLLSRGANPDGVSGRRPVVDAERAKEAPLVAVLYPRTDLALPYADTDVRVGDALLAIAAGNGDDRLVVDLLAKGADPDRADYLSPLLRATWYGQHRSMEAVLGGGADPNAGRADQLTLDLLVSADGKLHRLVNRAFVEVHGPTTSSNGIQGDDDLTGRPLGPTIGVSPLAAALSRRDATAVKLLLERGADANRPALGPDRPLSIAAALCDVPSTNLLLDHGARVEEDPGAAGLACDDVKPLLAH